MTTFKQYSKYFYGALVLVFCLFGGVRVVEAAKTYDISGQCVEVLTPGGGSITPDDICQAAGYGHCKEATGGIAIFQSDNCTGLAHHSACFTSCNKVVNEPLGVDRKSAKITSCGVTGAKLICGVRTWGILPKPDNVPNDFNQSIKKATNWILGFVGMIAVLMLIWGGINYLTSAGDEDKAKTGKKTIMYALIGLVIAGIAYALVDVIITVIL